MAPAIKPSIHKTTQAPHVSYGVSQQSRHEGTGSGGRSDHSIVTKSERTVVATIAFDHGRDEAGVDARVGVVAGGVAAPLRHTMQTESVAPPPGAANTALFRLLTEP